MDWLSKNATLGNGLLFLAAVSAIANAVRAIAPSGTVAAKVADKVLALSIDLHKLLGATTGPIPSSRSTKE